MAMQLQLSPVEMLNASTTSIDTALSLVDVTPAMVKAAGSERSARYAALTVGLSKNDRQAQYTKCVLYAQWKAGFKDEKNSLYKTVADIAANCGESRQLFGNLAKVGNKFFSDEHPTNKAWTDKEYSAHTLFELTVLPDNILSVLDTVLSQYGPKDSDVGFFTLSQTQARECKNAWNYLKKANREGEFADIFLYASQEGDGYTLYTPEDCISRICAWKLLTVDETADDDSEAADSETSKTEKAESKAETKSDKSGFSTFTFIHTGESPVARIYDDATEQKLLNYMGDIGFKVVAAEHKNTGITRTFLRYGEDNKAEIIVIGVHPLSVKSIQCDVDEYNGKVKAEMAAKGAGEYFRPYNAQEYVEAVYNDTFYDNL